MIFEVAMKSLENCVKDVKGEGFFAADIKMPTGAAKKKQGQEAWKAGKYSCLNWFHHLYIYIGIIIALLLLT